MDYEPIDLAALTNVSLSTVGFPSMLKAGRRQIHGLPFQIGRGPSGGGKALVAVGDGYPPRMIIPINRKFHHLIFAHNTRPWDYSQGDPCGEPVGRYVFHYRDGSSVVQNLRESFEFGGKFDSRHEFPGDLYFNHYPKRGNRDAGAWDDAGMRLVELHGTYSQGVSLWTWRNPHPDQVIASVEAVSDGHGFFVAGITGSTSGEAPFYSGPKIPFTIVLPRKVDAERAFDLRVEVDRGVATYPYSLPRENVARFLKDPLRGWGQPFNVGNSPAYAEVAASDSATVRVFSGKELLGCFCWGDLCRRKQLRPSRRLQVRWAEKKLNWVRVRILDAATRRPVACRIHFRSPEGIPFQPHGHHQHVHQGLNSNITSVGGDVRLGQITYAYTDGTCEGWLPRGTVLVDIARGFEYEPVRRKITIRPGQRQLDLVIRRRINLRRLGYACGDGHVHFISTRTAHFEAEAEDVQVVDMLQAQLGHLFESIEEFTGRPSVSPTGQSIVCVSSENRQYPLGHINLLGLRKNIMPWSTNNAGEAEIGATLEETLCGWADACHVQGGLAVLAHFPYPYGEAAALIATGRVDAIEFEQASPYAQREYYRYLNLGFCVPLVGGTDKMSNAVPIGLTRTYAHLGDKPLTGENWRRAIRGGNTFVSSGPLLSFAVNRQPSGSRIRLPRNGGTLRIEARAESIFPIHSLQIVRNGEVVAARDHRNGSRCLSLSLNLPVHGDCWLAARCGGPGGCNFTAHRDVWGRGVMAHASPVYVACGEPYAPFDESDARKASAFIEGALRYVRGSSQMPRGTVHPRSEENLLAALERPFHEAQRALEQRRRMWTQKRKE
jgi:hypothetical protein